MDRPRNRECRMMKSARADVQPVNFDELYIRSAHTLGSVLLTVQWDRSAFPTQHTQETSVEVCAECFAVLENLWVGNIIESELIDRYLSRSGK